MAWPVPGEAVASVEIDGNSVFQNLAIIVIFFITGICLRTEEVKDAIRQWVASVTGIILILLVTPTFAFAVNAIPFSPEAYAYGLAIFCLVPTTIASGITLVLAAAGNAALALLLTVVTNILAVFIVPFSVTWVLGSAANDVSISATDLLIKLLITILAPLLVGKFLREAFGKVIKPFVTKYKVPLGMLNNGSLIFIVWQNVSTARSDIVSTPFTDLLAILGGAIMVHVVFLIINTIVVRIFMRRWIPIREGVAVIIMSSQRTLPMAVTVISFLPESLGPTGQLTVPCVMAHIFQVLCDASLAPMFARRVEADDKKKKKKQEGEHGEGGAAVEEEISSDSGGELDGISNGNGVEIVVEDGGKGTGTAAITTSIERATSVNGKRVVFATREDIV
jgi:solute carrier family 10 (sodium/bile acid cotransporter), member 7